MITGPLLDFTAQNPSWAWAAGALVSTLDDLGHFFRALLGGRLLPPRLLAEMLSTVTVPPGAVPLPLYDRYGLGLLEVETPAGRLAGNVGGIPGFLSIVLSTPDGRQQLGVMINVLAAPAPSTRRSHRCFESSARSFSPSAARSGPHGFTRNLTLAFATFTCTCPVAIDLSRDQGADLRWLR